jgi:hypothetical protein
MKRVSTDISFITVNYNGLAHTRELLLSMKRYLAGFNYEVIVVDNGSYSDETLSLRSDFPEYVFIRSEKNLGFAGGNNLGINESTGRYIMLINNDTLLTDSSVALLPAFMDRNPDIAALSPKIHFFKPPGTIQFAGYTELSSVTLRNKINGYSQPDIGQYDVPAETYFVHGAAMMVRREAIEKAGLMCEEYFLYYEELDWAMRFRESGYKLWYVPAALIVHKESMSTGVDTPLKKYYMTRNRLLFASRNRRGVIKILSYIYLMTFAGTKDILIAAISARWDLAKAVVRGVYDFFRL